MSTLLQGQIRSDQTARADVMDDDEEADTARAAVLARQVGPSLLYENIVISHLITSQSNYSLNYPPVPLPPFSITLPPPPHPLFYPTQSSPSITPPNHPLLLLTATGNFHSIIPLPSYYSTLLTRTITSFYY